jgi:DNA polymerase (family 10)
MDNPTMARLLAETADLLEIDGGDSFRIRSYRRAAEAAEQTTVDLTAAASICTRLLEIPGIGKGMASNLQAIAATGTLPLAGGLAGEIRLELLELLKLPGMGPKTVALFWSAAQVSSIDQLSEAIDAGRLADLPRMGEKQIQKLRKGIEDYRRSAGRYRIDVAEDAADRIQTYLLAFPGIEKVTPAGSLRRGRETAGDLDLLVTGPACAPEHTADAIAIRRCLSRHPQHHRQRREQGQLQSSVGLQVDVRLLPIGQLRRGAAILYRLQGA